MTERLDGHLAVLYGRDEARLVDHVVHFLRDNLANGHLALIVATPAHRSAFLDGLRGAGIDVDAAMASGNLVCLDAVAMLENILNDGRIDWCAFDRNAAELVRNLRMRGPLCAYGETAGILWALGRHEMAIDLELHWNRMLTRIDCNTMCAYDVDVLSPEFLAEEVAGIVRTHDRILTCGGPSAA